MDDRIRQLAEFMGWEEINYPNDGPMWRHCDCHWIRYKAPPDPFTDANDCNALIKHLNEQGAWRVNINIESHGDYVKIWRYKSPDTQEIYWEGDNWMHGVAALALKVLK